MIHMNEYKNMPNQYLNVKCKKVLQKTPLFDIKQVTKKCRQIFKGYFVKIALEHPLQLFWTSQIEKLEITFYLMIYEKDTDRLKNKPISWRHFFVADSTSHWQLQDRWFSSGQQSHVSQYYDSWLSFCRQVQVL